MPRKETLNPKPRGNPHALIVLDVPTFCCGPKPQSLERNSQRAPYYGNPAAAPQRSAHMDLKALNPCGKHLKSRSPNLGPYTTSGFFIETPLRDLLFGWGSGKGEKGIDCYFINGSFKGQVPPKNIQVWYSRTQKTKTPYTLIVTPIGSISPYIPLE